VAAVAAGTVVGVHPGSVVAGAAVVVGASVVVGARVVVGATEVVVLLVVVVTAALMMRAFGISSVVVVVLVLVLVLGATVVVVLVLVLVVVAHGSVVATHAMSADACSAVPPRVNPAMMLSEPRPKVSG
jgi:hypothetical protein